MRMDIDIRVKMPDYSDKVTGDLEKEFIEGVMAVFRATFPEAEPRYSPGEPPAVTVSFWHDDGTPMDLSYKGEQHDRDQDA